MSDFESIMMDAAWDAYIEDLVAEQLWEKSKLYECIYLFVEGQTEESAYPELFAKSKFDFKELGIITANYNGFGNLLHTLRLMKKTLSHERPIIATIDNDMEGYAVYKKFEQSGFNDNKTKILPLPKENKKVKYSNGHKGGSFEEMFDPDNFITSCFSDNILPEHLLSIKDEFTEIFNLNQPWFNQIKKFLFEREHDLIESQKVRIGLNLVENCKEIPKDFLILCDTIEKVRKEYPIKHVNDVDINP